MNSGIFPQTSSVNLAPAAWDASAFRDVEPAFEPEARRSATEERAALAARDVERRRQEWVARIGEWEKKTGLEASKK